MPGRPREKSLDVKLVTGLYRTLITTVSTCILHSTIHPPPLLYIHILNVYMSAEFDYRYRFFTCVYTQVSVSVYIYTEAAGCTSKRPKRGYTERVIEIDECVFRSRVVTHRSFSIYSWKYYIRVCCARTKLLSRVITIPISCRLYTPFFLLRILGKRYTESACIGLFLLYPTICMCLLPLLPNVAHVFALGVAITYT